MTKETLITHNSLNLLQVEDKFQQSKIEIADHHLSQVYMARGTRWTGMESYIIWDGTPVRLLEFVSSNITSWEDAGDVISVHF